MTPMESRGVGGSFPIKVLRGGIPPKCCSYSRGMKRLSGIVRNRRIEDACQVDSIYPCFAAKFVQNWQSLPAPRSSLTANGFAVFSYAALSFDELTLKLKVWRAICFGRKNASAAGHRNGRR